MNQLKTIRRLLWGRWLDTIIICCQVTHPKVFLAHVISVDKCINCEWEFNASSSRAAIKLVSLLLDFFLYFPLSLVPIELRCKWILGTLRLLRRQRVARLVSIICVCMRRRMSLFTWVITTTCRATIRCDCSQCSAYTHKKQRTTTRAIVVRLVNWYCVQCMLYAQWQS